jgi:tRNA threonylcarbamoyl adenosine modification protein YeaZ
VVVFVLMIDTSSPATIAAVATVDADGVQVGPTKVNIDARAHGEVLAPAIEWCLAEARIAVGELGAIVAGTGPGPYTGLRVGLVTAAALADALDVPAYGVCSLDAIGAALPGDVLVAADARRREVYWATYSNGERVDGPGVAKPADLTLPSDTAMAGAGARLYADVLGLPLLDQDYPDPAALATLAADRIIAGSPSEVLVPLYLRQPDAVEPAPRKSVAQKTVAPKSPAQKTVAR